MTMCMNGTKKGNITHSIYVVTKLPIKWKFLLLT